jgi:TRAP-type C4-dicarboxylate transport system permease small subunit
LNEPRNSWWARAAEAGRLIENFLITALLSGLIVFSSAQIVLRNFFSTGFTWGDGSVRLVVLWLALLGALAASRDGRHITLGTATRWLPERWHAGAAICADFFAAAVSGVFAWYALAFVLDSREYGDVLLNDVPAWWLQAIMPVAFGLMACRFLMQGVNHVLRLAPRARTG